MSEVDAILLMKDGIKYNITFGIKSLDRNHSGIWRPGDILKYCESDDQFEYVDLMEGQYYFKLPDCLLKEQLKSLCDTVVLVGNNKQRFSKGPGLNNCFARLFFCHPSLVNKAQILFSYNYSLTPTPFNLDIRGKEIFWQFPNMKIIIAANNEIR